ncbi:hypothetical protein A7263_002671 [Escherichia coli]|nr:hypothetical protein [Escherichia coli]
MTTITKERIELFIKNPLENGLTRGEQMELARIALASLEADPVKRVNSDQMRRVCLEANRHLDKYDAMAKEVNKLLGRIAPPAPVVPEGLVKAVRFYEQVKCENPPAETGAWKDAVDWVLKEACQAVNIGIKGE